MAAANIAPWSRFEASALEPDTCRICRGEGMTEEPLFYPCKCSGSIKYVHQNCLMEWLAHSQKKHCELCKTSFRFTKLYAPNMPKTLPWHVCVSHTVKYAACNVLVWLRAFLVISVWLGCLPYLMRTVWSFLFWISDEGFRPGSSLVVGPNVSAGSSIVSLTGDDACPANPFRAATTCPANGDNPSDLNWTPPDPVYLLRLVLSGVTLLDRSLVSNATMAKAAARELEHASLLSDVALLRQLTRSPVLNRMVITALEGQIITVLVIVCFILIILVRDYVVQQQPELDNRAGFAAGDNAGGAAHADHMDAGNEEDEEDEDEEVADTEDGHVELVDEQQDEPEEVSNPGGADGFVGAVAAEWAADMEGVDSMRRFQFDDQDRVGVQDAELWSAPGDSAPATAPTRVGWSEGGSAEGGVEIIVDRAGYPAEAENSAVGAFLRIYREADGEPNKILAMVKDRNLEDKLEYWTRLMTSLRDRNTARGDQGAEPGESSASAPATISAASLMALAGSDDTGRPSSSRSSDRSSVWSWPNHSDDVGMAARESAAKGKGRLRDNDDGDWRSTDATLLAGHAPRPRANTDGPRVKETVSPLANHSWSFANLATATPAPGQPEQGTLVGSASAAAAASSVASRVQGRRGAADQVPGTPPAEAELDLPTARARPAPRRRRPNGLADRVADFMWREVDAIDPAELAPLDGDDDAEWAAGGDEQRDQDAMEVAGLDAEVMDNDEDMEGVLELLGMRGPVIGLLQNVLFCCVLVLVGIGVGVFLPYNIGRLSVWVVTNPMRMVRMALGASRLLQDLMVVSTTLALYGLEVMVLAADQAGGLGLAPAFLSGWSAWSWRASVGAASRIVDSLAPVVASPGEVPSFSAVSHADLLAVKAQLAAVASWLGRASVFVVGGNAAMGLPQLGTGAAGVDLAHWGGGDRFWAVACGYLTVALLAALYLRRGAPLSTTQYGREWETSLIDALTQASGVIKVMLIIGIEMLVFPLYCGLLLDLALLPLFEHATLRSRLLFGLQHPLTSVFVHWFVGTGYMFHFALFVSMCRKITRKGVLYFIRDPDDPDFHPVRDVLERSVAAQLKKILFSAFVYGALVLVCLGGVVWGLSAALPGVLPVRHAAHEPVLEFPLDLLFYNLLMPLAVGVFRPSDGLHAMYTWWFRSCARALRITWFLFGERRVDEEGVLRLHGAHGPLPWWRALFFELDKDLATVVPKTWARMLDGARAKPAKRLSKAAMDAMDAAKTRLVETRQLVPDGRFVRAPASDQVKIPKGKPVFFEVAASRDVLSPPPDFVPASDKQLYWTSQFQYVYVPPHFRARVLVFIALVWLFAAVTGVGITMAPLVVGRRLFKLLMPAHMRTNDIYAFSIGMYVLGCVVYGIAHLPAVLVRTSTWVADTLPVVSTRAAKRHAMRLVGQAARLAYAYFFLLVAFPLMVASILELYALIPLHTYLDSALLTRPTGYLHLAPRDISPMHSIRVLQAWTIGLLYLKLCARVATTWFAGTRISAAVRAVLRRGWLDPDLCVLTRAFIVPGTALWVAAVTVPLLVARFTVATTLATTMATASVLASDSMANVDTLDSTAFVLNGTTEPPPLGEGQLRDAYLVLIYRLSFPFMALALAAGCLVWSTMGVFQSWKIKIRDETYLIGERLHNHAPFAAFSARLSHQGHTARDRGRGRNVREARMARA